MEYEKIKTDIFIFKRGILHICHKSVSQLSAYTKRVVNLLNLKVHNNKLDDNGKMFYQILYFIAKQMLINY